MQTVLFYDGRYIPGAPLQILDADQINATFGFQYLESNLTEAITECLLNQYSGKLQYFDRFFKKYKILNNPERVIAIHKPSNVTGYGLVAVKPIAENTVVFEYLGERDKQVAGSVYTLDIVRQIIEPKLKGNLARFSLHLPAQQPPLVEEEVKLANLYIEGVLCADGWHAFLITKETIKPGDELGWHYGYPGLYINKKNGEFFKANPISAAHALELYSPMIEECRAALKQDTNNVLIMQNLTYMLHLKGDANMLLENYNDAYLDYTDAVNNIDILSLRDKAKYLCLQFDAMIEAMIPWHLDDCTGSIFNSFFEATAIEQSSFKKIEQLAEFINEHRNNKSITDSYTVFVAIYNKLLPLLQRPAGFCTEAQADTLKESDLCYSSVHEVMCDFPTPSCENGVDSESECRYVYDIFTNCRPLISLSEILADHDVQ